MYHFNQWYAYFHPFTTVRKVNKQKKIYTDDRRRSVVLYRAYQHIQHPNYVHSDALSLNEEEYIQLDDEHTAVFAINHYSLTQEMGYDPTPPLFTHSECEEISNFRNELKQRIKHRQARADEFP